MRLGSGVVVGSYRLERLLGEGGMGTVWAASHRANGNAVALKLLRESDATNPVRRKRLLREARAASAVTHPNVVRVHEVFEDDEGTPVIAMELLSGQTLAQLLAQEGALSLGVTATLIAPVVSAVGTAHAARITHRDLKPDNIFLVGESARAVPIVLDFGIARLHGTGPDALASAALTTTGAVMGTPHYMAPEQIFGEHDVDHRADVWALGVILYECLAGRRPLPGANIGQVLKVILSGKV
ncbi:MAG TPA: serine/threonine-protein kinase, partial [Polyangiaceae bacterium]